MQVKYIYLKVFYYKVFVHVPKELMSKFDSKTFEYIFLCYEGEEFDFKFWDPKEKKIVRSWDMVFRENYFGHFLKGNEWKNRPLG